METTTCILRTSCFDVLQTLLFILTLHNDNNIFSLFLSIFCYCILRDSAQKKFYRVYNDPKKQIIFVAIC